MLLYQAVSQAGNCKWSTRICMRVPACSIAYHLLSSYVGRYSRCRYVQSTTCSWFDIKPAVANFNLHRRVLRRHLLQLSSLLSLSICLWCNLGHQVSAAMKCSTRSVAMAICVMLVFASAAEVNAQCSLSALAPCYGAVQGAYPPRPNGGRNGACCRAVMVANPACLCSQMQQGRYPQSMIRNAFAMPRVCGRTNLRGYKCGSKYIYWSTCLAALIFHCEMVDQVFLPPHVSCLGLYKFNEIIESPRYPFNSKTRNTCSSEKLRKFINARSMSL